MEAKPIARRVLGIPELIGMILHELDTKATARMARTSKSTHFSSIKRLWGQELIYFRQLVNLVPSDLFSEPEPDSGTALTFCRPAKESDFYRFQHYSTHVTSLNVDQHISPDIFLVFTNRNIEFFPILCKLTFKFYVRPHTSNLVDRLTWLAMVGPPLKSLKLRLASSPTCADQLWVAVLTAMLKQLSFITPQLKKLSLPPFYWHRLDYTILEPFVTFFRTILPSLTSLVALSWKPVKLPDDISYAILEHPTLNQIHLGDPPFRRTTDDDRPSLPSLKWLRIDNCPSSALLSWLHHLPCPELLRGVDLRFVIESWDEDVDFRDLQFKSETLEEWYLDGEGTLLTFPFTSLLCQAANLTHIFFRLEFHEDNMVFSWRSFEPLLGCKRVSDFSLTLSSVPLKNLDDAAIGKMARSWGELERFIVAQDYTSATRMPTPSVTFYGLEKLARYCPKLREITLTVSMMGGDPRLSNDSDPAYDNLSYTNTLERLNLHYSEPGEPASHHQLDPRRIARILRRCWPRLKPERVENNWDGHLELEDYPLEDLPGCWHSEDGLIPVILERFRSVQEIMKEMDLHTEMHCKDREELEDAKRRILSLEAKNRYLTRALSETVQAN